MRYKQELRNRQRPLTVCIDHDVDDTKTKRTVVEALFNPQPIGLKDEELASYSPSKNRKNKNGLYDHPERSNSYPSAINALTGDTNKQNNGLEVSWIDNRLENISKHFVTLQSVFSKKKD